MKKKGAAWKGVLLFAAAFALPLCLGAGPAGQKGPVGEGEIRIDPGIMLPGPDAPTPEPLPITPLPGFGEENPPRRRKHPCCPWDKGPKREDRPWACPFLFSGDGGGNLALFVNSVYTFPEWHHGAVGPVCFWKG